MKYIGLIIIGIFLLIKETMLVKLQLENFWTPYGYVLNEYLIREMFRQNFYVEIVLALTAFIGLFIPKNIGYVLLSIYPFFAFGYFFFERPYIDLMWGHILFAVVILTILNLKIIRSHFKIETLSSIVKNIIISAIVGLFISIII